jgi:hypothetical protein
MVTLMPVVCCVALHTVHYFVGEAEFLVKLNADALNGIWNRLILERVEILTAVAIVIVYCGL